MPRITCNGYLQTILRFPDCVNTADVKNYAYSTAHGNHCPSPMKRIPVFRAREQF